MKTFLQSYPTDCLNSNKKVDRRKIASIKIRKRVTNYFKEYGRVKISFVKRYIISKYYVYIFNGKFYSRKRLKAQSCDSFSPNRFDLAQNNLQS